MQKKAAKLTFLILKIGLALYAIGCFAFSVIRFNEGALPVSITALVVGTFASLLFMIALLADKVRALKEEKGETFSAPVT